jgi:hypothetical protein
MPIASARMNFVNITAHPFVWSAWNREPAVLRFNAA